MKKKLFSIIACGLLVFGLTGCDIKKTTETDKFDMGYKKTKHLIVPMIAYGGMNLISILFYVITL